MPSISLLCSGASSERRKLSRLSCKPTDLRRSYETPLQVLARVKHKRAPIQGTLVAPPRQSGGSFLAYPANGLICGALTRRRYRGHVTCARSQSRSVGPAGYSSNSSLEEAGRGHTSEIADAEALPMPRGCPWQAWSVGEALRLDQVILTEQSQATGEVHRGKSAQVRTVVVEAPAGRKPRSAVQAPSASRIAVGAARA